MRHSLCLMFPSGAQESIHRIVFLLLLLFCCLVHASAKEPSADLPLAKPAAIVNGTNISDAELADACLARYGSLVVGALINKVIIEQACERNGVAVTTADVDNEINEMSRRFNVPRDKWIALIQRERGVTEKQYREDIVWPMIALRRLAKGSLEPTDEQLRKQFQNQYGPTVKARIIVLGSQKDAEETRTEVLQDPDSFGLVAREKSVDIGSASVGGWVQPIRHFSGSPEFESAAFALSDREISKVVQVADQFIIIKCEGHLPASDVKFADVRPRLAEVFREKQSRVLSGKIFGQLQSEAAIENALNSAGKALQSPNLAARVNGRPITISEVRAVCVERYGEDVLQALLTGVLLNQALARQELVVSQEDVEDEVARAAESMGFQTPEGSPDVPTWLEQISKENKQSIEFYLTDIVRPTVALKKLVGPVAVTQDDLDKAFTATFGPRVRCRAVVLDNQRRAQEVWQIARQNPTPETIGDLAEQYSVDPTSKALRGEVPPIQKYSGQPALEREAFALKTGELSGIIQIADRFMILLCEGYTKPVEVTFDEVRKELHRDIFEKKQRIEMARYFTHLRESASIDNFLAGTSQSPKSSIPAASKMPPSTITQRETNELSRPRAGSRTVENSSRAVSPASFDEPLVK
ncbi:MAG: peptidylprolyl isomerase [Pirellulales bacterium]